MSDIAFWVGVVLLVDGSLGLWNHQTWQAKIPQINILRIAWVEITAALLLVLIHFLSADPRWLSDFPP